MIKAREEIKKHTELCLLFDYYGKLLTPKRQKILHMSVEDDLSLAEIADSLGTSRQAVHANIQQATLQLQAYEDKLGVLKKDRAILDRIDTLLAQNAVKKDQLLLQTLEQIKSEIL